jgi:predicted Zn-dependent protease
MKDRALTVESTRVSGRFGLPAASPRRRSYGRILSKGLPVLLTALALSGCQSILEQSYKPDIAPSQTPQIVDEVQKNDPRAEMGAREHPRIVASYGGEYKDVKTEQLVARIMGALTVVSENPAQSYRITILNSPAINAFALPGGYVYVTRGLLALATDASEVAAVLSHEMAHVTANHGIERQQREEAEVIASRVVTEVLSSDIAGKQAPARSKLRLAAFSRNQELQADVIGVRMLGEAGYDPYAAARFLDAMGAYARFNAVDPNSDQGMDFLSSHPSTPQRVELARRHARAFGMEDKTGDKGRGYFLQGIDGLLYGDSPQEGYVRGQTFLHANLGIRFEVPVGFRIDNKAEAVMATGPGETAVRFDLVDDKSGGSLTDYIASGWETGLMPETVRTAFVNGMPAATARASADRWDFDVTVVRNGPKIYRFLTAVPKGEIAGLQATATKLRSTFRRLTAMEKSNLKPLRIRVVTVEAGDTVQTLSVRMLGSDRKLELFRLLIGMPLGATVAVGDKVKIVSE